MEIILLYVKGKVKWVDINEKIQSYEDFIFFKLTCKLKEIATCLETEGERT